MSYRPMSNELEAFTDDLDENMAFLKEHLSDVEDVVFAASLCEQHEEGNKLSEKQLYCAMKFWREAHDNSEE